MSGGEGERLAAADGITPSSPPSAPRDRHPGDREAQSTEPRHGLAFAFFSLLLLWPILSIAGEGSGLGLLGYITIVWASMTATSFALARGGRRGDKA